MMHRAGYTLDANVVVTLRDPDGTEHRYRAHNSGSDAYGILVAKAMAANPGLTTLPVTHCSIGRGGQVISAFDSIAGWSGTPVLDVASFVEGTGSISRSVVNTVPVPMQSGVLALDLTGGGDTDSIEWWTKVSSRSFLDLTTECFRLSTTAGVDYFSVTWAQLETALGAAFIDGTWTRVTIPKTTFTETGTPLWSSITSITPTITANGVDALTCWWDDVRRVPLSWAVTPQTTVVESEAIKVPVGTIVDNADGTLTVTTYFGSAQAVGTYRLLGLYGNGGATLAAIVALDTPLTKSRLQSATVAWTVSVKGN